MRDKFIKFMYGRYGMDLMGKDMLVLALLFFPDWHGAESFSSRLVFTAFFCT